MFKKTVICVALSTLFLATGAQAGTVFKNDNGDNLKVYGGAEVGGTFVSNPAKSQFPSHKRFVNDSFMTLGLKGQTGDFYAKFELDAEYTDWTAANDMRVVIDKGYVGFNLPMKGHSIEFGRTDTAYDHYDAFGDFSNELSAEVSEAGDQDNTIKYQGTFDAFKFGISHSLKGWDVETVGGSDYVTDSREGAVTNGYVGYFSKAITVIAAAETVNDRGDIYSLHAAADLGDVSVGGFASISDRDAAGKDTNTYVASVKYSLTDKLSLLATGNVIDKEKGATDSWFVAGAEYNYARNVKLAAEISNGDVLKGNQGTLGYVKAYYWF